MQLAVTLGDEETAVADLTLSASSSAQGLVPDANIVLGGSWYESDGDGDPCEQSEWECDDYADRE